MSSEEIKRAQLQEMIGRRIKIITFRADYVCELTCVRDWYVLVQFTRLTDFSLVDETRRIPIKDIIQSYTVITEGRTYVNKRAFAEIACM